MTSTWLRVGGVLGIVSALAAIPSYAVASPDQPNNSAYGETSGWFLTANAIIPLLHLLTGMIFLAVLLKLLRSASPAGVTPTVALVGGIAFFALNAAGLAAEVAIPAAVTRFDDPALFDLAPPFLMLALWLYHYCQIGAALLIFATAVVTWRTAILPRFTVAFAVLGILPLLHTWVGVVGAYSTLAWFFAIGLTMLFPRHAGDAGAARTSPSGRS